MEINQDKAVGRLFRKCPYILFIFLSVIVPICSHSCSLPVTEVTMSRTLSSTNPMSSAKDYVLNIETDANRKAVTFSVHRKPSFFFRFVRTPLVAFLLAICVPPAMEVIRGCSRAGSGFRLYLFQICLQGVASRQSFFSSDVRYLLISLVCIVMAILLAMLQQPSDSIMIMENMGVQLSSKKWWSWTTGLSNGEFIPLSDIIDIVIHEGFHGYGQVIFYMCVLTRARSSNGDSGAGNSVKVVFPHFLPRKDILLQVWKQSRAMLYGEKRKHFRYVPGQGLRELKHFH